MAIWGAPEPIENTQIRACSSIIKFDQALHEMNRNLPSTQSTVIDTLYFCLTLSAKMSCWCAFW